MMQLYPRLPLPRARAMCVRYHGVSSENLRDLVKPSFEGARFAPTGGARVSMQELMVFKRRIEEVALAGGWPADSLAGRQHFDREVASWLGDLSLPPGEEVLRAETWAWFAVQLTPHIVRWRFAGADGATPIERFAGSVQRNTIGRLWLRGWVLDQGEAHPERWSLAQEISEDAAVAILERTTVASQHRVARMIAHAWLVVRSEGVRDPDGLLREAIKRIRVQAVARDFSVVDDEALSMIIRDAFALTLATRESEVVRSGAASNRDPL